MLVLGPNSTCDVCLECYTTGVNVPHAITCGHVFCQKCLDHLMQHKCPLCRERFSPHDVRKLHVDRDPATTSTSTSTKLIEQPGEPVTMAPQIDNEAQRLLDDIARIVKEGGKVNEIRRVIDECRAYYKSQPGNQYTPVRVSCLLLHNLLEAQRKLVVQTEQLREATEIRGRLTSELEEKRLKYEDLERTSRDEKETALAIEKSLREHYDQMNAFWKSQMESASQECRSLREDLSRYRSSAMAPPPSRAIELQYFHRNESKRSCSGSGDLTLSQAGTAKGKVLDDEYDFHLSPLAEVAAPLMSTAPSFMALADDLDQDELVKAKRAKSPIQEEPEPESELDDAGGARMAYPFPAHLQPPSAKVDPIPIPTRTPPSRQSSVMAMSVTADAWPSSISCSKPRDDVVMSSRPPSPTRRHSSDRMPNVSQGPTRPVKDSYAREMTDLKRRDSTEVATREVAVAKDHLVSKLHDLLDSPRPSLQQYRAELPEPTPPLPRPTSRPSRSSSTAQQHPGATSTSIAHYPDDPPHAAQDRKPLVRASDVAMQLEKERLERLEKERRRLRETSTLSSSLKDATNVPVEACHLTRHKSKGGGRPKGYHASAEMYA